MRQNLLALLATLLCTQLASSQVQPPESFKTVIRTLTKDRSLTVAQRIAHIEALQRFDSAATRVYLMKAIKGETDPLVFDALVGQLRRFKHTSIVPAMRVLLRKATEDTHRMLARELSWRDKLGMNVLLGAFPFEKRDWARGHLIDHFDSASPKAVSIYLRYFPKEIEANQQKILWKVLWSKQSRNLTRFLLQVIEHENFLFRVYALTNLARLGHPVVQDVALELATDPQYEKDRKDDYLRGLLCFCLLSTLDDSTVEPAFALASMAGRTRDGIALMNWILPEPQRQMLVEALLDQIESGNLEDMELAIKLFGLIEHESSARALTDLLSDPDPKVVSLAITELQHRKVDNRSELQDLVDSPEPANVIDALLAMSALPQEDAEAWATLLMRKLDSEDIGTRILCMDLLAAIDHMPALESTQQRFDAPDWQERSAAYTFCRAVRDISTVPLLIERLEHEQGRLHAEVLHALRELTGKRLPGKADYWRRWWKSSGSTAGLVKAVEASGEKESGQTAPDRNEPGSSVLTYYGIPIDSKHIAFIVDVSGSMKELSGTARKPRIDIAKQALLRVIDRCPDDVDFNLITFHTDIAAWKRSLQRADADTRDAAKVFVRGLKAGGGTNIHDALALAFEDKNIDTIYLLSDGDPSAGAVTDAGRLVHTVRRWNLRRRIVIHAIAIGQDRDMMKQLAKESGGEYVLRR